MKFPRDELARANLDEFQYLSEREKQVLSLMAEGKWIQEISDQLLISRSGVTRHLSNIASKWKVSIKDDK